MDAFAFIFSILSLIPTPARFEFQVLATQPVMMSLGDKEVYRNKMYQTQPLFFPLKTKLNLKFVSGDDIISQDLELTLRPGQNQIYTIQVHAIANERICRANFPKISR